MKILIESRRSDLGARPISRITQDLLKISLKNLGNTLTILESIMRGWLRDAVGEDPQPIGPNLGGQHRRSRLRYCAIS